VQDGVVDARVIGCRTGHVDVQVAEGQVAEHEDASIGVHPSDRGFERLHECRQPSEWQPDVELVENAVLLRQGPPHKIPRVTKA